jgi:hypothetical protein
MTSVNTGSRPSCRADRFPRWRGSRLMRRWWSGRCRSRMWRTCTPGFVLAGVPHPRRCPIRTATAFQLVRFTLEWPITCFEGSSPGWCEGWMCGSTGTRSWDDAASL